jgi:hypothetical protein
MKGTTHNCNVRGVMQEKQHQERSCSMRKTTHSCSMKRIVHSCSTRKVAQKLQHERNSMKVTLREERY